MSPLPTPLQESRALLGERVHRWLTSAQQLEAAGQLESAIAAYGEILEHLDRVRPEHPGYSRGLVAMNRANALFKLNQADCVSGAVAGYEAAVRHLAAESRPTAIATRAAAWMNRGIALLHPLVRQPAVAAESFRAAAQDYQRLPLDWPPHRGYAAQCRVNEAAAWLQLGGADASDHARTAAEAALELIEPLAQAAAPAAAVTCAATELLCAALRPGVSEAGGDSTRTRISDALDHALALIRQWEQRAPRTLLAPGRRLFRLAAQFYAEVMPAFFVEVMRENLDPDRAPPTWAADTTVRAAAADAAARLWHEVQNDRIRFSDTPTPDLDHLSAELESLRPWLQAAGTVAA